MVPVAIPDNSVHIGSMQGSKRVNIVRSVFVGWLSVAALEAQEAKPMGTAVPGNSRYQFRANHDPDGIGKFYLGREISHVMGHLGAGWLERSSRVREEAPAKLIQALELKPGMRVADIGSGSGYFTRRLAAKIGPTGLVYAVDIQPEMIRILNANMAKVRLTNFKPVLSNVQDPKLPPASVDLVLMVDVYHEFSHPHEMMTAIRRALKPEGRVAFVEYRGEDDWVPIKPLHKMTEAQVRREAEYQGFRWLKTIDVLPRQHIILFEKE